MVWNNDYFIHAFNTHGAPVLQRPLKGWEAGGTVWHPPWEEIKQTHREEGSAEEGRSDGGSTRGYDPLPEGIYLFYLFLFLAVLGLHSCSQAYSSCGERGLLSCCGARASRCSGCPCGALVLEARASAVAAQ